MVADTDFLDIAVVDCDENGDDASICDVDIDGGFGEVVYEVLNGDPVRREDCDINVWFIHKADTANDLPAPGTGQLSVTFDPLSTEFFAEKGEPVPRFIDASGDPTNVITISSYPKPPPPPPPPPGAAQALGMVVDPTTSSVIVFNADADAVLATFPVPIGGADCSITPDQAFGFVTNFSSVVTVIDLNALALLPGIPISNFGIDTSITPAGDCLVVCDGSITQPVSAIDVGSMTEVSTLALPSHCTSVDVWSDGTTVLATSIFPKLLHRLTIGPGPTCTLTDTGDAITTGGFPENVTCAPDSGSLVAILGSKEIRSFTTPPLAGPVSTVGLTGRGSGMSVAFNPSGTVIYARSERGSVDAFTYSPATGTIGPSIGGAFPLAIADTVCCPFGVDHMALHPNGSKLYVSQPGSLDVFDATTGALLTSITDPAIVSPTGVCLSTPCVGDACKVVVEPPPPPPPPPRLVVSPNTLSFDLQEGSEPASQPFTVHAIRGTVRYSIRPPTSWLSASPDHGVSDGETDTILAIVNPQGLAPGAYSRKFFFRENGVLKRKLEVILNLSPAPPRPLPPPSVSENAVVNAASFIPFGDPGHAMAPGSVVAIFGSNFTDGEHFEAENIPLPFTLGGVSVTFNGLPAALYGVWPDQINAQLPWGLIGSTSLQALNAQPADRQVSSTATLVVENANGSSDPSVVEINTFSPAIFTTSGTGAGQGTVFFANTLDLVAPVGFWGNSRPAKAEDLLTIYANGLGPVDPPIEDGYNSCGATGDCLPDFSNLVLRGTTTRPVITIGGGVVPDENVLFSGLSPRNVALYQVDIRAPQGLPSGDAVPIVIHMGELESRGDVTIAVD